MKKIVSIFLSLLLMLTLTACGDKKEKTTIVEQTGSGMIDIYYPMNNKVVKSETPYQIKQPDSVSASVEEVMAAIMVYLQEDMTYYTYMLDADNRVSLELAMVEDYDSVFTLLADASIVKTLFQIKEIQGVRIHLVDKDGNEIEDSMYTSDSFYFYDYEDQNLNSKHVRIYYGDEKGFALKYSVYLVSTEPNVTVEEKIIVTLAQKAYIPRDTKVNYISINDGICYLDLNRDFMEDHISTSGIIPLYAVVNSITSLDGIEAVQITIDGQTVTEYRDGFDISKPLTFNEKIVEANN